jgi:regulator of protease activity HflC (stomatin/prohibitin superfamily)
MTLNNQEDYKPGSLYDRFSPGQIAHLRSHRLRAFLRLLFLLLLLLLLLLPGYFLNRSLFNDNTNLIWVLASILPGLIALAGVLVMVGVFVKTVFGLSSWVNGLQYGTLCIFGRAKYAFAIIGKGKVLKYDQSRFLTNRELGGPGKLVIHSDSAVILERYGRLSRVEGPGIVFLKRFERIREIIDLRPQIKNIPTEFFTRDGIAVETDIRARFQIKGGVRESPKEPYPVDKETLEQAARAEALLRFGLAPPKRLNWLERIRGGVEGNFRGILARRTLDQLFEPSDVNKDPRDEIGGEILEQSRRSSGDHIEMLDLMLGPFKPVDPSIEQQWRAVWQARQEADKRVEEAHGEAYTLLARETAYAYAQLEMMLAIDRSFQKLVRQNRQLPPYFVALRFIETLRRIAARSGLGRFLPMETVKTLEFLNNKLLESPAASPSSPPSLSSGSSGGSVKSKGP